MLFVEMIRRPNEPGAIEWQERRGQQEMVDSTVLPDPDDFGPTMRFVDPNEPAPNYRGPFEALGIIFGEAVEGDPLFVHVTLPTGWTREGTEHAMWSKVLDDRGEARISVGYKAAFYDRWANMHVIALCACSHSQDAHPWQGRMEEASPANDWSPTDKPQPCKREGCGCADFAAAGS